MSNEPILQLLRALLEKLDLNKFMTLALSLYTKFTDLDKGRIFVIRKFY